jgi:hypothetical protein
MAANFEVKFIVDRTSAIYKIRITDTSTGFTLTKANTKITFPDGYVVENNDVNSPDITIPGGYVEKNIRFGVTNKPLTGTYKINFTSYDASLTEYTAQKQFDFTWQEPSLSISDVSDTGAPFVKFKDSTAYDQGNFTESAATRRLSVDYPTTSDVSGEVKTITTTATNLSTDLIIDMVNSGNYYEGIYAATLTVDLLYSHTNTYLSVQYKKALQSNITVKRVYTQTEFMDKINDFKTVVDSYKTANPSLYDRLLDDYDEAIALYTNIVSSYKLGLTGEVKEEIIELLTLIKDNSAHTYQSTPILAFSIDDNDYITTEALTKLKSEIGTFDVEGNLISINQSWTDAVLNYTGNVFLGAVGGVTTTVRNDLVIVGTATTPVLTATTSISTPLLQITGGTGTQGQMSWNTDEETVDLILNGSTLQLGQEVHVHVRNNTLSDIPNGTPVYVTGTLGASGRLTVAPMIADGSVSPEYFIGVTTEAIEADSDGKVTWFGKVRGIDTTVYGEGVKLYVSETVAGGWQTTAPTSPNPKLEIAFTVNSKSNGELFVRSQNGHYLQDNNDVEITSVADKDLLVYNSTSGVWENSKTLSTLSIDEISSSYLNLLGDLDVNGDVNIDGGDLTTNSSAFNLLNLNATTINAFGAASTINMGNAATLNLGNGTVVAYRIDLGGTYNAVLNMYDAQARSIFSVTATGTNVGSLDVSKNFKVYGNINATGTVSSDTGFSGDLTGNADTATTLATARTITIGSTGKTFDGSANVSWTSSEVGFTLDDITTNGASTTNNITVGDATLTGALKGPSTFYIDPSPDDTAEPGGATTDTGLVVILGDLQVTGNTTTVNSTVVDIADLNITLASNATNASEANGAGITIAGANAYFSYTSSDDRFIANKNLQIYNTSGGNIQFYSTPDGIHQVGAGFGSYLSFVSDINNVSVSQSGFNWYVDGTLSNNQAAWLNTTEFQVNGPDLNIAWAAGGGDIIKLKHNSVDAKIGEISIYDNFVEKVFITANGTSLFNGGGLTVSGTVSASSISTGSSTITTSGSNAQLTITTNQDTTYYQQILLQGSTKSAFIKYYPEYSEFQIGQPGKYLLQNSSGQWFMGGAGNYGGSLNVLGSGIASRVSIASQYAYLGGTTGGNTFYVTGAGDVTANSFTGSLSGNASTASAWATARTITVDGDASGSVAIDGSSNVTLTLDVSNITGDLTVDSGTFHVDSTNNVVGLGTAVPKTNTRATIIGTAAYDIATDNASGGLSIYGGDSSATYNKTSGISFAFSDLSGGLGIWATQLHGSPGTYPDKQLGLSFGSVYNSTEIETVRMHGATLQINPNSSNNDATLELFGSSYGTQQYMYHWDNSYSVLYSYPDYIGFGKRWSSGIANAAFGQGDMWIYYGHPTDANLDYQSWEVNQYEQFRLKKGEAYFTGNLLVNKTTSDLSLPLEVNGAMLVSDDILVHQGIWTTGNGNGLYFTDSVYTTWGTSYAYIWGNGGSTASYLKFDTNAGTAMTINHSRDVGIGNTSPKGRLDVNGTIVNDSKTLSLSATYATAVTVNMNAHTGCYVKITAFGDWSGHSTIAYIGEFFLQHGADAYAEPGTIIRQIDNTATDFVTAQIVDPTGTGAKNFEIQLKTSSATGTPFTAHIQYEVRGQFNSVS